MKKLGFLLSMFVMTALPSWAQGARSIRITEVMTDNRTSIVDEYGKHKPWVELSNTSFTTYNIRGMFITTDRSVLDPGMTPEQRRRLMSPVPNNEARTTLAGKKSVVFYDRSWSKHSAGSANTETGPLQMNLGIKPGKAAWVALYDGNAVDLIDSVSVPVLLPDQSYELSQDFKTWSKADGDMVTPGYLPQPSGLTKSQQLKKADPYGIGITVLSMGIVFVCLALLFLALWVLGIFMKRKQQNSEAVKPAPPTTPTETPTANATETSQEEIYMAVIALALKEHLGNKHDTESGVLTIKPKQTRWNTTHFNNF